MHVSDQNSRTVKPARADVMDWPCRPTRSHTGVTRCPSNGCGAEVGPGMQPHRSKAAIAVVRSERLGLLTICATHNRGFDLR